MKSILKNTKAKEVNLAKEVSNNDIKTYLHLVLELPPERLHIEGYRIVLGRFAQVAKSTDPTVVIAQYEDKLEVSAEKAHTCIHECIEDVDSVLELVTQI